MMMMMTNNKNFSTSTNKNPIDNKWSKNECSFQYKKAINNNRISRAKLISDSKTIFYKEIKTIKQTLINNGFPNYIADEQIKRMIKQVSQQNKHCNTPLNKNTFIRHFYRNEMHNNYELDEHILIHWFKETYSPVILIKIKLIIYYNKSKISNPVINNNFTPSIVVLKKKLYINLNFC